MRSGKWTLVSSFAMLHSIWRVILAFQGYAHWDTQEFLCEILDKIEYELETRMLPALLHNSQRKLVKPFLNVVNNIFHGKFLGRLHVLHVTTNQRP